MKMDDFIDVATDLFARVAGCFILGTIIGLIFGIASYPLESIGVPIFVLLILEFSGAL